MEAQVSSEQSCSAEADTTAVVWKQRLDFLDEEDITSQYNDQMKETLGSNASTFFAWESYKYHTADPWNMIS